MNMSDITPILNVSDMEASFRWFEASGSAAHSSGAPIRTVP